MYVHSGSPVCSYALVLHSSCYLLDRGHVDVRGAIVVCEALDFEVGQPQKSKWTSNTLGARAAGYIIIGSGCYGNAGYFQAILTGSAVSIVSVDGYKKIAHYIDSST